MENTEYDLDDEIELLVEEFSVQPERLTSPTSRQRRKGKLWLPLISLAGFFAVYYFFRELGLLNIVIFIGVLLFHEAGHIMAMNLLGYSNPTVLFIPLLGALAFTEKKQASLTDKVWVSLAGPLPGLAIGLTLMFWLRSQGVLYISNNSDWRVVLALTLVVLNFFNLLPVYPLDGGQIASHLLFLKFDFLGLIFQITGCVLFCVYGWITKNWLWAIFALFVILIIIIENKKLQVKRKLHRRQFVRSSLELRVFLQTLLSTIQETFPKLSREERLDLAREIINDCRNLEANWLTQLSFISLYIVSLIGSVFLFLTAIAPGLMVESLAEIWLEIRGSENILHRTEESLKNGHESTGIRRIRTFAFRSKGELDKATFESSRAIELAPAKPEFYNLRYRLYKQRALNLDSQNSDRYDLLNLSIKDLDILINLEPQESEYYYERCELKYLTADYQSALQDCDRSIELAPDNPEFYNFRYRLYKQRALNLDSQNSDRYGLLNLSIKDLDILINLEPQESEYYYERCESKYFTADYQSALKDCNRFVEKNPNTPRGYNRRGAVHEKSGNYTKAMQDFNRAISLNPKDSEGYWRRAYLLTIYLEKDEDALKDINRAIELNPSFRFSYWVRSRIWQNLGEEEKAAADMKTYNE